MRIVLDIETNLAHDKIHVVVTKNIDTGEVKLWKAADNLREYLKDVSLIVMHNGISFDAPVLNRLWKTKIRLNQVYDTLIVSRLLDPSRENGHSLEAWGQTLGFHKIDYAKVWTWFGETEAPCQECNGTGKKFWHSDAEGDAYVWAEKDCPYCSGKGFTVSQGRREQYSGECFDLPHHGLLDDYCVRDVEGTAKLYLKLVNDFNEKQFSLESLELENSVAAIIAQQERNGFKLDQIYATCLLTDIKSRVAEIYERMQSRWPPVTVERYSDKTGKRLKDSVVTFNPGSRQQIGERLKELGWKPKEFTETGIPKIDETVLAGIKIPEAQTITEYLMLNKRISQIESWMEAVGKDGRVHGKVITNGAVTGRMTHSSPNMAQIPNAGSIYGPECRECWTVEEGNVLVGCDASGLELRMLAHYMKDNDYVRTVTEGSSKLGTDVHTVNQRAAGLATRDNAKTFIYAFLYGAGDAKIGSIVGGTAKVGKELKSKFLRQTPSLAKLIERVGKQAAKGWVPGLDGRRIWVRSEHAALNSLLQGAGAIVMKKALVIFDNKRRANNWPVKYVANVHDEFQMECPKEIADIVGAAARMSIIEAGEHYKLRCPLDGEYKIGANWRQTH
jgi:DNA polymerase I-like protein with 3'-5' exonuclease and polymerase domains